MGSIPKGKSLDTHRVQCRCPVTRMRFFFVFFCVANTPLHFETEMSSVGTSEGPHLSERAPHSLFPTANTIQRARRSSRDSGSAGPGGPTRAKRAAVRAARRLRAGREGGAWRRGRSGEARRGPSGAPARVEGLGP